MNSSAFIFITTRNSSDFLLLPPFANFTVRAREPSPSMEYVARSRMLWMTVAPVILVSGLLGNAASLMVFTRASLRTSSTYTLLSFLAVSDSLVLVSGLLRDWLAVVLGPAAFSAFNAALAYCIPVEVASLASMYCSAWLIVAVTVDRFLAICSPMATLSQQRTPRRSALVAAGAAALAVGAALLVTFGSGDRRVCFTATPSQTVLWLDAAAYSLLPSMALFILNGCILHKMIQHSRSLHLSGAHPRPDHRSRHLSAITLAVSVSYLVTTLPNSLLTMVAEQEPAVRELDCLVLVQTLTLMLWYSNHAVNFGLYCLTARQVRSVIREMVPCTSKGGAPKLLRDTKTAPQQQV